MAETDYFLELEGIPGESKDKALKGQIDVESWSWGESNSATVRAGDGLGKGKVSMNDFIFTTKYNKASPMLFIYCATGQRVPKAVLTCRKAGGSQEEYLKVTFHSVMISSYQTGGSGGDVIPVDHVSLNYKAIEFQYHPQDEKGGLDAPLKAGYDLMTNKPM